MNFESLIRATIIGLLLSFTAGCAHFVEQQVLYPGGDNVVIDGVNESELLEMHHLQRRTLSGRQQLPFYFGDAETLTSDYIPPNLEFTFSYTNAPEGVDPIREYRLELEPRAEKATYIKGIVILLHSYSTNAQSVFFDSTALQLQGYHTAIIDLLGHGTAKNQPVSFGDADVKRLHRLVTELSRQYQLPIMLYGKSYGASIAAQYIASHGGIAGFIAVAPMTDFTPAAMRMAKSSSTFITSLVSDQWLQDTFDEVLTKRQTSSHQLSTPRILMRQSANSLPPSLIVIGSLDKISDSEQIQSLLQLNSVQIETLDNRGHIEMMIYDDQLNGIVKQWLDNVDTIKKTSA